MAGKIRTKACQPIEDYGLIGDLFTAALVGMDGSIDFMGFLFSRLMCWVAIDRRLRLAAKRSFPAPTKDWRKAHEQIHQDIYDHFWDEGLPTFAQCRGSRILDAASLPMPLVHFISPVDPRWLSHLRAIERDLVHDSLVYRYDVSVAKDGLTGAREHSACAHSGS